MRHFILFTFTMMLGTGAVQAQWQFGVNLRAEQTTPTTLESSQQLSYLHGFASEVFFEYRFRPTDWGITTTQYGIRADLHSIMRTGLIDGNFAGAQVLRLPIRFTSTMPRRITGELHPLFEVVTGAGGYMSYQHQSIVSESVGWYWGAGLIVDFGLNFYIQHGSRVYVGYQWAADVANFGVAEGVKARNFASQGFTIGWSASFFDIKERRKADRERRAERRAARRGGN